jgi:broad specificity phosphatase PhoE
MTTVLTTTVPGRIVVVRHGETTWSSTGRHTGRTDVPLTAEGEQQARSLAPLLAGYDPGLVLSSPASRASRTAELAGLQPEVDLDLQERGYGAVEGLTTPEVRAATGDPDWNIWSADLRSMPTLPIPADATSAPGETLDEVAVRLARVLARCAPIVSTGRDVLLFSHGHTLRILGAIWMRQRPEVAAHLLLQAAHLGVLAHEREIPVISAWNLTPFSADTRTR